ncbi:DUF4270 domain-containing protein [Arenibacter certesii]|uniref:DUF4270 domain-containing protein n=1 Tax=Arenibacter certesii TaxID=228955 RepID=A0A918J608_9FLAO|nr:DUF4270 domain-containing protein [Arenibacter certesii]GGW49245.1 hypothetical protein GCM10007383_36510 [Arenibacter certesii]
MNLRKGLTLSAVLGLLLSATFISCEEDFTTLGSGVVGNEPFTANKAVFDVFAYNKKVGAVRTNRIPVYQIGNFNDPIYGTTEASITTQVQLSSVNPVFGKYSAEVEAKADSDSSSLTVKENETVKEVYLYIPFLVSPFADKDGEEVKDSLADGTPPSRQPKIFDLDSIFGNRDVPFRFKVERSTYFLRDLDPNSNFQEAQSYYSNQRFSPNFVSDVLFDGEVEISNKDSLEFAVDNPDTDGVDESEEEPKRTPPGIKVPLDKAFFQANILDKEGSQELFSQANFVEFFRGIHLSVPDDILLLLDLTQGYITMTYEYDSVTSSSDATIKKEEKEFLLSLIRREAQSGIISGNAVNTFINADYPTEIANAMDTGDNASKLYIKGGAGSYAQIKLFDETNGEEIINQIKDKNWIINEANLVFYVDRSTLNAAPNAIEPSVLYLYKENGGPVYNPFLESQDDIANGNITNYDGKLYKEDGKGDRYKIRITNLINDIIVRDSTNATLNLTVTSDIRVTNARKALLADDSEVNVPLMSIVNPFGTVLIGSGNVPNGQENRKLQLEIFYTKAN